MAGNVGFPHVINTCNSFLGQLVNSTPIRRVLFVFNSGSTSWNIPRFARPYKKYSRGVAGITNNNRLQNKTSHS